ncbi:hypothetical protein BDR22DRAFT_823100 [Usnea florida]
MSRRRRCTPTRGSVAILIGTVDNRDAKPRIFLTGATSYVGGDVLHRLQRSRPAKSHLACLVRDASKAKSLLGTCPDIEIVHGSLDDGNLVEQEARKADVVLGLLSRGYGPRRCCFGNCEGRADSLKPDRRSLGGGGSRNSGRQLQPVKSRDKVYNDGKDVDKIRETIRDNPKRENNLLSQPAEVRTASLIGPLIYGEGRGPLNQRTIQALKLPSASSREDMTSVFKLHDLSDQIVALTEAAIIRQPALWNETASTASKVEKW